MKRFTIVLFLAILIWGCSKNDSNNDGQVSNIENDTLTNGWSKVSDSNFAEADIFFTDPINGFCTGARGTYKSNDGGVTFNKISNLAFINIGAYNTSITSFVGNDSARYLSANVFTKPTLDYSQLFGNSFFDVFYSSANVCYYVANNSLWKSTDGGRNLVKLNITNVNLSSIYSTLFFIDDNIGWLSTDKNVYKTVNGGQNWTLIFSLPSSNSFIISYLVNANVGYVFVNATLYKTVDGGNTFQSLKNFTTNFNNSIPDIGFFNSTTGFVSIQNKVYITRDGGQSWQTSLSIKGGTITEIHFINENTGWAATTTSIYRFKI